MEIQYRTTRRDAWRCNLHILLSRPTSWLSFLLPPLLTTCFAYWLWPVLQASPYLRSPLPSPQWWWLPALFLFIFSEVTLTRLVGINKRINKSYPDSEDRPVTTTTLTPECLCDCSRKIQGNTIVVIPIQIPWHDIVSIQWHESALYFQRKNGMNFIPHTAFASPSHAQQFVDLAQSYWQSARSGVEVPVPQDVWPPAPRL